MYIYIYRVYIYICIIYIYIYIYILWGHECMEHSLHCDCVIAILCLYI